MLKHGTSCRMGDVNLKKEDMILKDEQHQINYLNYDQTLEIQDMRTALRM